MECDRGESEKRLQDNSFSDRSNTLRSTYELLRVTAARLCGSQTPGEIIEDVVHETLVIAMQNITDFRQESQLQTWMIAILRNKCCDLYRHRARPVCVPLTGRHCDTIPAQDNDMSELEARMATLRIVLAELIANEPPGRVRRQTLEFLQQLTLSGGPVPSHAQMAEKWNCSTNLAKWRWNDARRRVKAAMLRRMRQLET